MKTGLMALSIAGFVALGNQTNVLADTLPEVGADTGQQIDVAAAADTSNVTKTVPNAGESTQQSSDVQTTSNGAADISDTTKAAPNTEEADQTTENKQQTSEEETNQLSDETENAENSSESENEGEKESTDGKEDQEEADLEQSKETETAAKAAEETASQTGDQLDEEGEDFTWMDEDDMGEGYDGVFSHEGIAHYKGINDTTPLFDYPEWCELNTVLLDGKEFTDYKIKKIEDKDGSYNRLYIEASYADKFTLGEHEMIARFASGDASCFFVVLPEEFYVEYEDDEDDEDQTQIGEDYYVLRRSGAEYVKGFDWFDGEIPLFEYLKGYELNAVLLDGKEFKDYKIGSIVTAGPTYWDTIYLDSSYIEKLPVGEHEVIARFAFGDISCVFSISDFQITRGDEAEYVKGSGGYIIIGVNGQDNVDIILIDGEKTDIPFTMYAISGAEVCTFLDSPILEKMSVGEHKVTFRYENGQEISAVIYIKEAESSKDPEQNTGDSTQTGGETEVGSIKVTEGDEAEYTKGSGKGIAISLKGDIADIETILIDGKEAENLLAAYKNSSAKLALARSLAKTSRADSNVITLETSLLEGLSVGKHEITFRYKDGSETTTVIYVKEAESGKVPEQNTGGSTQTGGNPETGNGAQVGGGAGISGDSQTTAKPSGSIKETNSVTQNAAASKSESPKTGDTGFFGMMTQMLLAFGAAIVLAGKKIRDSLK